MAFELRSASGKMPSDLTIVVAYVTRMGAIRSGLKISGRVAYFASSSLGSALEAIQTHGPRAVAIDSGIVQTQQGSGFVKRVENLALPNCPIRLIIQRNGAWKTVDREPPPVPDTAATTGPQHTSRDAAAPPTNTRRAPRFPMLDAIDASVEGGQATIINISVLGAQLVSVPVLRPGQTVKIALPDANELLRVTANVAWSTFQQTAQGTAVYRAVSRSPTPRKRHSTTTADDNGCETPLPSVKERLNLRSGGIAGATPPVRHYGSCNDQALRP